jgi:hypothetical protein
MTIKWIDLSLWDDSGKIERSRGPYFRSFWQAGKTQCISQ